MKSRPSNVHAQVSLLGAIIESSVDAIYCTNLKSVLTTWNRGAERLYGYSAEEVLGTPVTRLFPPDLTAEENGIVDRIRRGERVELLETRRLTKAGRVVEVSVNMAPIHDAEGGIVGISRIARDHSAIKAREREVERLSRLYAALSAVNQAIVSKRTRDELFTEVCDVLVRHGTFLMAWIGWNDPETHRLVPLAVAGDAANLVANVTIYTDDRPEGRGPSGTAFRQNRPYICNDIERDPGLDPWRAQLRTGQLRSLAAFPIRHRGEPAGMLVVYAGDKEFFQEREIALLAEAAGDISFALDGFGREERLRRERAFSDAMLNSMPGILYLYDTTGKFLRWNRGFELLTGRSADEIEHMHPLDFFSGADKDLVGSRISEVLEKGQSSVEAGMVRPDGQVIPCYFTGVRVEFEGRTCVVGMGIDVSAKKQAEASRQATEARYRALFEQAPDGIVIADPSGTYLDANAAICRMLGYTPEELIGKNATDIVMPDETKHIGGAISEIQGERGHHREWLFRRKDGVVVPGEVMGTMMPDGNIMGIIRDITDRRRVEAERRESEERFRATFEQAAVGIAHVGIDGGFLRVNNKLCEITGYTRDELLKMNFITLTLPEDRAESDQARRDMLSRTRDGYTVEKKYQRRDGSPYWVSVITTLLWGSDGKPKYFITVTADISARKQLEEQFLRSQRMESLGALAGGIAHDFNNLLSPVLMGSEILRLEDLSPSASETITSIEMSARRGADLVKQLMSFARGTQGALMTVQVGHIMREMQRLATTFPKNITFRVDAPKELWPVQGDPTQLNQILLNLCVNARDAMPDGGALTLAAENVDVDAQYAAMRPDMTAGRYVKIRSTDTGTGIPPDVKERIFEPFFTTKDPGKGTGLGLSTVREIVRSHGGHIAVESVVGRGTTFEVLLPAAPDGAEEAAPVNAPAPARGAGEAILVVESNAPVLRSVTRTLEGFGYRVSGAEDGAEAVAHYALGHAGIAAVLLDMASPLIAGPALIRVLRRINADARIIAMSGHASDEGDAPPGVAGFLKKPFSGSDMLAVVARVVNGGGKPSG